jgi:hypothetical protein
LVPGIAIAGFGTVVETLEESSTGSRRRASRVRAREPEKAIVQGRNFRSCTLVVLFSETAVEEPFTPAEGICMGLDSATRDGRRCGSEAATMYTGIFVH